MRNLLGLLALLLFGCSHPPQGTPVAFDKVDDAAYRDKQVVVDGYPSLSAMTMETDTVLVDLSARPDHKGPSLPVSLKVGNGANQVERLPDKYTQKDLRIHLADGTVVGTNDHLQVNARLLRDPIGNGKFSTVLSQPVWLTRSP